MNIKNIDNIKDDEFSNITLVSLFLMMLKPFMLFTILIPFFILLKSPKRNVLIYNKKNIFFIFFILIWFLKNILLSGCVIFPVKETCFNQLEFTNKKVVHVASQEAEAWAKGYPDSKKKLNFEEYNSNFNWLTTWSENHLKKIIKKFYHYFY